MSPEHPHAILALALWDAVAEGDAEAFACYLDDGVEWKVCGRHQAQIRRGEEPAKAPRVIIELRSAVLRYSFASEWGGDAIVIGYGCEVYSSDPEVAREGLDLMCVRLLTRHPNAKRFMKKHIGRAAKYFYTNPLLRGWALQKLTKKPHLENMYDSNLWLTRTKCEICEVCDMPLLDHVFAEQLV